MAGRAPQRLQSGLARHGPQQQQLVEPPQPDLVGHPGDRGDQVLQVHRLGQEILGAELHGLHRGGDVAVTGQEDDRGVSLLEAGQGLQPIHAGQVQVEHHHLGAEPVVGGETGFGIELAGYLVAGPLEDDADRSQDVHIVIDQQYRIRHRWSSRSGWGPAATGT